MLKKVLASLLALTLVLAPAGNIIFDQATNHVSAKSYKSGKKSFNINKSKVQNNDKKSDTVSNSSKTKDTATKSTATKSSSGGLMKGLLFGGLAGLLLGGLLGNLGVFGAILGLMVNVIAVIAVIVIIRKIVVTIKNRRKEQAEKQWRN